MNDFSIDLIHAAARALAPHAVRTPLLNSPMLDARLGLRLFVKAESLQLTGSFKLRGALNKVLALDARERAQGIVTFSAGNHGQAVAAAGRLVGAPATIVLPSSAPRVKVEGCRWWGAKTVFYDPDTQDRGELVQRIVDAEGCTLVHPFDDPLVMAGQGTVGLEIVEQLAALGVVPDAAVVNCSGGGLVSGVLTALRASHPAIGFHLCEIAGFEKCARSLASGRAQESKPVAKTIMDGINGPNVGEHPLAAVLSQGGVGACSVGDEQALHAMRAAFDHLKLVVEPAGAASLAAVFARREALAGKTVVVVASGGNVDAAVFVRALA